MQIKNGKIYAAKPGWVEIPEEIIKRYRLSD